MSDERDRAGPGDWNPGERLDSWKEIAAYLRRDERTARRWAEAAGLPVRRAPGHGRRPVFAFKREIDDWLRRQDGPAAEPHAAATEEPLPPAAPGAGQADKKWRWAVAVAAAMVLAAATYFARREGPPPANSAALARPGIHSLAVLPLANLSGDPRQDYIAEALTDELITNLAQIQNLRVISRTSVLNYAGRRISLAQVRRELQVDAVVEGSVARSGRRLRLNAQLIAIPADRHLWARKFEGSSDDLIAMEDQLSAAVAAGIRRALAPGAGPVHPAPPAATARAAAPPVDPAAYDEYLHGLYWLDRRDEASLRRARGAFLQAARRAPRFAPAFGGLAQADVLLADYQLAAPASAFPRAQAAARQALALNPRLAAAHAVLAFTSWRYRWDRRAAAREFAQALALDPNNATAHEWHAMYLAAGGQTAAAAREFQQAVRLDPLSRIAQVNLGVPDYYGGHVQAAIRHFRRALALAPGFGPGHIKLWLAYACAGDGPRARDELQIVLRIYAGAQSPQWAAADRAYRAGGLESMLRAYLTFRQQDARHSYVSPYGLAMLAALAGDRDAAFRLLRRAVQQRDSWLVYARVDPAFAGLRADPRWAALLKAQAGL